MGIIASLNARPKRAGGDNFMAAEVSRLTTRLATDTQYINTTLRYQLRMLRARSRQACKSNPFAKRFVSMVVNNVCGPNPFLLQSKVKFNSGRLDLKANKQIEETYKAWGRKGQCEITGKWAWSLYQRSIVKVLATDGEVLLRRYKGPQYGKYGYQFQLIDIDRLDETKNESLKSGGAIHMGVEIDSTERPVAYHVLKRKPSQWNSGGFTREYQVIPADEIIHLYVPDYAEQIRGAPWMYSALLNLVHLGAFEEAAVIAANVGAAQMGFIELEGDASAMVADGKDHAGNPQIDAEPAMFTYLPAGHKVSSWMPKYPDAAVEPFIKAMLRGISSGLDVAYHNLSSDMEGVNYSSARIAELDERDHWMTLQSFMIDHLHQPCYEEWLQMQMLLGNVDLNIAKIERYKSVRWQPRRWAWVDPVKEVRANVEAIDAKIKSRTRVAAEQGEDIEDVFEELAEEEILASAKKLSLEPAAKPKPGDAKPPKDEDEEDPDDDKDPDEEK